MIISTSRSSVGFFFDVLLTVIGWIAFVYLFGAGILAILHGAAEGPEASLLPTFLPTLGTLSTYALIAAINAAILICWALYNHWRFTGLDRRKPIDAVSIVRAARSFSVTVNAVSGMRAAKILTVHHNAEGCISASIEDTVRLSPTC